MRTIWPLTRHFFYQTEQIRSDFIYLKVIFVPTQQHSNFVDHQNDNNNVYYFWQPQAGLNPHVHANT